MAWPKQIIKLDKYPDPSDTSLYAAMQRCAFYLRRKENEEK